jgi:Sec-independent protein translocase protein TatA
MALRYDGAVSDIALLLLVILIAVLLFRAPKTLPQIGAALGRGVREARHNVERGSSDDEDDRPAA